jgi:hypothetical protein
MLHTSVNVKKKKEQPLCLHVAVICSLQDIERYGRNNYQ